MGLFDKFFGKPDDKVTKSKNHFENNVYEDTTRTTGGQSSGSTFGSSNIAGTGGVSATGAGTSGLADQSLLGGLTGAVRGINPSTGAPVHDAVTAARMARGGSPAAYQASSGDATKDFFGTLNQARHAGAGQYRSGDYQGRAFNQAADTFGENLISNYGQQRLAEENALLDGAERGSNQRFSDLRNLAGVLNTAPFTRQDTSQSDQSEFTNQQRQDGQITQSEFQNIDNLLRYLEESGFNEESSFRPQTSPFGQLLGVSTAVAGALTGQGDVAEAGLNKVG